MGFRFKLENCGVLGLLRWPSGIDPQAVLTRTRSWCHLLHTTSLLKRTESSVANSRRWACTLTTAELCLQPSQQRSLHWPNQIWQSGTAVRVSLASPSVALSTTIIAHILKPCAISMWTRAHMQAFFTTRRDAVSSDLQLALATLHEADSSVTVCQAVVLLIRKMPGALAT